MLDFLSVTMLESNDTVATAILGLSLYLIGMLVNTAMIMSAINKTEKCYNVKWYRSEKTSLKIAITAWIAITALSASQLLLSTNIILPFDADTMDSFVCRLWGRMFISLAMCFYIQTNMVFTFSLQELYQETKLDHSKSLITLCKMTATIPILVMTVIFNLPKVPNIKTYYVKDNKNIAFCILNSSTTHNPLIATSIALLGVVGFGFLIVMLVLFVRALKKAKSMLHHVFAYNEYMYVYNMCTSNMYNTCIEFLNRCYP